MKRERSYDKPILPTKDGNTGLSLPGIHAFPVYKQIAWMYNKTDPFYNDAVAGDLGILHFSKGRPTCRHI